MPLLVAFIAREGLLNDRQQLIRCLAWPNQDEWGDTCNGLKVKPFEGIKSQAFAKPRQKILHNKKEN